MLTLRQSNLEGYYTNSINNKEVLKTLEKVDECFEKLIEIDILMKSNSVFEAAASTLQMRHQLKELQANFGDCVVIKQLVGSQLSKTKDITTMCSKFLRSYFFSTQTEFSAKTLKSVTDKKSEFHIDRVDLTDAITTEKKLATLTTDNIDKILTVTYGINLESLKLLEIKLGFIKMIIDSKPKNYIYENDQEYNSLATSDTLDNIQLTRFISTKHDLLIDSSKLILP